MEENKSTEIINSNIYKKEAVWLNLRHFGLVLNNLALFLFIVSIAITLSSLITALAIFVIAVFLFTFLMVITVATLGLIYLATDIGKMWTYFDKLFNGGAMEFVSKLYIVLPFTALLGCIASIASVIVLSFVKQDKRTGRIVAGIVYAIILFVITISAFVMRGM